VAERGFGRVLVTGGAGFIGSNLVRRLLAQPQVGAGAVRSVVVLDLLTYAGHEATLVGSDSDPRFSLVRGDISDLAIVDSLFEIHEFDTVYHLAAESHVDRSILFPGEFVRTNVVGSWNLLECARRHWRGAREAEPAKVFVHVSTDEVFGDLGAEGKFSESTAYDPSSPYSASKAAADHFARAYFRTYGLPVVVTNCSNNYGPYQFPEKLIPVMITRALGGLSLPVYGDGQQVRDWLHVQDHCEALLAVGRRARLGATYTIGAGCERTNIELVHVLCDVLEVQTGVPRGSIRDRIEFVPDRPGHDRRYAVDASKINKDLGWTAEIDFEKGIADTVAFYLREADGWVRRVMESARRSTGHEDFERRNYAGR